MIGLIFTSFFGLGLFMVSISPVPVDIQAIVLGNILAVTPSDTAQLVIISVVTLAILLLTWRSLMACSSTRTTRARSASTRRSGVPCSSRSSAPRLSPPCRRWAPSSWSPPW